ncbi:MAG: ImmA/IrrE family metallo-endopeptidase [Eubacterium sp.]|nr:ImmA/IrrE family metallo-endopeptidase [Eubacterium sp.]
MTFDKKPLAKEDFKRIYTKANEVLVVSEVIDTFPFSVTAFVREMSDVSLCSYSKAGKKFGIPENYFKSEDAEIMEMAGMYVIFYKDIDFVPRKRFSIIHEYSHYLLGHKLNLDKDDPLYQKQEIEANCCAAQILIPEQIIRVCQNRQYVISQEYIIDSFGVSGPAADKRRGTLAKFPYEWKSREEKEYDDIIRLKYSDFINIIAPKKSFTYDIEEELESQRRRDSWHAEYGRR